MKEYRAMVKHRKWKADKWLLAVPGQRSYKSLLGAQTAIQMAIENGKPRVIKSMKNGQYVENLHDDLEVVATKIESREVTEWELEE